MEWSKWQTFPDPRNGGFLSAPFGPGVYQVRHRSTGEMVLFGIGGHCAKRMSSLLPEPFGCGGRNNNDKREYLLQHLADMEYRCMACESVEQAKQIERRIKRECSYKFAT